jgi:molybdopterin synthase catalytic subunit
MKRGATIESMRIRLLAFASASDALGAPELEIELAPGTRVGDLRRELGARFPALSPLLARLAVAIDGQIAGDTQALADGAEVALLPPVSGG